MPGGKKKRNRRAAPLDTEAGKKAVEQARQYFSQLLGEKFTRFEPVGTPSTDLLWTSVLPGFAEARESAFYAWTSIQSETEFHRTVAAAKSEEEFEQLFASARLRSGVVERAGVIAELERAIGSKFPGSHIYKLVGTALRDAERNHDENMPYFREYAAQIGVPISACESLVVTYHKSSLAREIVVMGWISCGLWLLRPADVLAWFVTKAQTVPELAKLKLPDRDATVADWVNHLGLVSYKGAGRMVYNQHGQPTPDKALIEAVGLAHTGGRQPPFGLTQLQHGDMVIFNCERNYMKERDLGQ